MSRHSLPEGQSVGPDSTCGSPGNRESPPTKWGERVRYGQWTIELDYPPIPIGAVYLYTHDNYDGPEDQRHCGWSKDYLEALDTCDEIDAEDADRRSRRAYPQPRGRAL